MTLGEIVDAVMSLSPEERRLLLQMIESSQNLSATPFKTQEPSEAIFSADGILSAGAVQSIMEELNATLDSRF
jgi:hypothetical protein